MIDFDEEDETRQLLVDTIMKEICKLSFIYSHILQERDSRNISKRYGNLDHVLPHLQIGLYLKP